MSPISKILLALDVTWYRNHNQAIKFQKKTHEGVPIGRFFEARFFTFFHVFSRFFWAAPSTFLGQSLDERQQGMKWMMGVSGVLYMCGAKLSCGVTLSFFSPLIPVFPDCSRFSGKFSGKLILGTGGKF